MSEDKGPSKEYEFDESGLPDLSKGNVKGSSDSGLKDMFFFFVIVVISLIVTCLVFGSLGKILGGKVAQEEDEKASQVDRV